MEEKNKGFVIPARIEVVTKTVGQIAVTILVLRLICSVIAPRIIVIEKHSS
jgi:hypothetical protein